MTPRKSTSSSTGPTRAEREERDHRPPGTASGVRTPLLSAEKAAEVRERFGTPCYVYDRSMLESAARRALAFRAPYGFRLRYAMKANSSRPRGSFQPSMTNNANHEPDEAE